MFVSFNSFPQQYYWLYLAFKDQRFDWLISNEVLTEYEEILSSKYSVKTANLILSILGTAPNVIFSEPYYRWNLINADPDDNKFVDLAIAGNADYLVTYDRHFDQVKLVEFPKLNIVNMAEFKSVFFR